MRQENKGKIKITRWELVFAVLCFVQGTMLRTSYIIDVTKNDSWAMAVSGLLLTLLLISVYSALMRLFPGKSLIEINDIVFGAVLGKAVSILYLFYFLSLCALNTRDLGNFVVSAMLPNTPLVAVITLFLLACVYTLRKGVENLLHLSIIIAIAAIVILVINAVLILKDVRLSFLKPFFTCLL
jgi:Spore germination protein.